MLWPALYLTFDDGPDPYWTPRVADELERADVRGTFFAIGERVVEHVDVVRDLVRRGHEVELHCMRHVRHTDATQGEIEDDTREALAALQRAGVRPRRWRPPGGGIAPFTAAIASGHGLQLATWSVDPRDWAGDLAGVMLERIAPTLRPGAAVVMHDGVGPGALRGDCAQTVELIEPLVAVARERRLRPLPLGRRNRVRDRALGLAVRRSVVAPAEVEIACVDETGLVSADLAALSELLAESMTRLGHEYRARPWRQIRPEFRAIARSGDGAPTATVSGFRIGTEPQRVLYGLGDLAVARAERGRGLAKALSMAARAECWRRGAEIVLMDSKVMRPAALQLGYAPVPRFRFYYERDGACHWHSNWAAMIRHPEPRARLRLEEGDF